MASTIFGFAPPAGPESTYLMGPRMSDADVFDACAKVILAFAIYGLTCPNPDLFLIGSDGKPENECIRQEIVDYAIHGCGLSNVVDTDEIDWLSDDWTVRKRCAELLWDLYEEGDFQWYTGRVAPLGHRLPLHAGLYAFVQDGSAPGPWSIGDTIDMAVLFETLFNYFNSYDGNPWLKLAQDLRPYQDAFVGFRSLGAYAIRGTI